MSISYQLLPPLTPDEYWELRNDISAHGVQVPIITTDGGEIVDGHHRAKIARQLGVPCPETVVKGYTDTELRSMAVRLNVNRRHLSRDQRRELIRNSVKADPQLSDRQHAERTGASPTTVGTVRAKLEDNGAVSKLDTRVDAKGVEQPASKPTTEYVDTGTGEILAGGVPKPISPHGESGRKPARSPLSKAFETSTYTFKRYADIIDRLLDDDRFAANREIVAERHLPELLRVQAIVNRAVAELGGES